MASKISDMWSSYFSLSQLIFVSNARNDIGILFSSWRIILSKRALKNLKITCPLSHQLLVCSVNEIDITRIILLILSWIAGYWWWDEISTYCSRFPPRSILTSYATNAFLSLACSQYEYDDNDNLDNAGAMRGTMASVSQDDRMTDETRAKYTKLICWTGHLLCL